MQPGAPLLVISPHLDDAVLSCAHTLVQHPGSTALTLFAGVPAEGELLTAWDRSAGFGSALQAITERRAEDAAALALLHARPRWLDFGDRQYGPSPSAAALADAIEAALGKLSPAAVLLPLGLFHSDHELAHDAALRLLRRLRTPEEPWIGYEDVPYPRQPGLLQRRLALLRESGVRATPLPAPHGDPALKARAIACYASQLRALAASGTEADADSTVAEGLWRLELQR